MADTDITLSIDLDAKDALQTAKELGKEIEKSLNSQTGKEASAQMSSFNSQLKQTTAEASRLGEQLNEISNKKVPTEEYNKLNSQMEALEKTAGKVSEKMNVNPAAQQMDALQRQKDLLEEQYVTYGKIFGEGSLEQNVISRDLQQINTEITELQSSKDWKAYSSLEAELEKIQAEITEINRKKQEMESSGKAFVDTKSTEEYKKLETQLDKVNDKTKLLLIRKRELAKKEAGVDVSGGGSGGGGALGFAGSFAALSKNANKALAVVSKIGKTLKKALFTVAAITLGVRGIMGIIRRIRRMIIESFKEIIAGDNELKKKTDAIKKSWDEVKVNLAAAFLPIVELAIPYLQQLLNWINLIISKLSMFIALIAGQNAYTKAIKKTGDAAASASKQLSKFDELNNLSSGGGGDSGSNFDFEKVPIDDKLIQTVEKLKELLGQIGEKFKELVATPFLEGFFGSLGDWEGKVDKIKENIKSIGRSLIEIYMNPELMAAQENYVKSFSRAFGAITGLAANLGLNIGEALTGGIAKFLEDHKEEISNDLTDMFTIASSVFDNITQLATDLSSIVDTIGESEALQGTISNLIGTVYELYMAIEMVFLKLLDLASGTIAELIHNNVENIKKTLEGLFQVLEKVAGFLQAVATTIRNILVRLVDDVITPLLEPVKYVIQQLLNAIFALWEQLQPVLLWLMDEITALWTDYVDPVLNDIIDLVKAVAELIMPIIKSIWDNAIQPVIDLIMKWMPTILSTVKITFDAIIFIIKTLMIILSALIKAITDVVRFVTAIIKGDWKTAWEMCLKFVKDLFIDPAEKIWGAFTKYFEDTIDHYLELLKNIVKGVVGTGEVIVNALVSLINEGLLRIVNGATSALNLIPGVDIPQVPEIPKVSWTIPGLAQGAVIPPSMHEFIAKLGDNNSETEIVSPLSTMKEALLEALRESGGSGGDIHVHVDLEGREIAKAVVKQNEIYKRSTGRTMFA